MIFPYVRQKLEYKLLCGLKYIYKSVSVKIIVLRNVILERIYKKKVLHTPHKFLVLNWYLLTFSH